MNLRFLLAAVVSFVAAAGNGRIEGVGRDTGQPIALDVALEL